LSEFIEVKNNVLKVEPKSVMSTIVTHVEITNSVLTSYKKSKLNSFQEDSSSDKALVMSVNNLTTSVNIF